MPHWDQLKGSCCSLQHAFTWTPSFHVAICGGHVHYIGLSSKASCSCVCCIFIAPRPELCSPGLRWAGAASLRQKAASYVIHDLIVIFKMIKDNSIGDPSVYWRKKISRRRTFWEVRGLEKQWPNPQVQEKTEEINIAQKLSCCFLIIQSLRSYLLPFLISKSQYLPLWRKNIE